MGYARYILGDGRAAGYAVEAECDHGDCHTRVDRGLGYLCGQNPVGHKDSEEPGCGNYYCEPHKYDHACPAQECGAYAAVGKGYCGQLGGHEPPHNDKWTGEAFEKTEDDLVNENGLIPATSES